MNSYGKTNAAGRLLALLLAAALLLVLARFPSCAAGTEPDATFSSGAVLLDASYSGKNILIQNGVFSVTVSGATDVNIIFDSVTMDRRYDQDTNGTVAGLYNVATSLGWQSGTAYYAQTCPLLITNGASVTVAFRGENRFYAGTNRCRVYSNNQYSKVNSGGGFAGIQVDAGSSLTIAPSGGTIHAFGAFYVEGDNSENADYGYSSPSGTAQNQLAGGAGIGGGVAWNTTTCASQDYTAGTPGTIVINGGNVYAYGGHQAAGIGGGLNSAATDDSITINGGMVCAYGGRWAAGIGDGDSLQGDWTTKYTDPYRIVINGGTVDAVGGVACPGIGSTDELTSGQTRMGTSGMEITINGGQVTAKSGYPDGFDPDGQDEYTGTDAAAAIGAGNKTNLEPNSISVVSAAKVIASGFGHYSMTENGTVYDALPTVNIDSDGYMFLGRFPVLASYAGRIFELFEAQHFFLEVDGILCQYTKYTTQPANGGTGEVYYYCPEAPNRKWLIKGGPDGGIEDGTQIELDSTSALEAEMKNLSLTLYVDETSVKITEVVAPAHFRSIALSLPTPEEHGGIYALCIPTDAMYGYTGTATLPASGFAVITIGAQEQGTLSGEVSYPSALNIRADSVSETLSDLDAYLDGLHTDGRDGLVGDAFSPNRYAYRVYIGHDDDTVYLYAKFPLSTIVDTVLESFQVTATESTMGTDRVVTAVVDMTGVTEKTVRLKKTDTVTVDGKTVTLNSVVYKITLVKKTVYTMELSSLDKTYDGLPAAPAVKRIYAPETGEDYSPSAEELAALEFTYYREDGTSYTEMGTQPPKNAGRYKVSAVLHGETCTAFGEATFTISRRILTVSRIQNHLTYVSMAEHNTWTAPRDIDDPGTIILSGIIGTDDVSATAERVYYNDISIGYDMYKITLTGIVLAGADVENYETASTQRVFGQISYSLDGAIFRKKPGLPWDKFYPVDSLVPVSEDTADYHSPATDGVYDAHGDYVYARTQNRGDESSVYAVDISFGAMCFSYSRAQWNPDSMIYEELAGESRWNGFDGSNNAVSVTNRSNSPVYYAANCKIHFLHAAIGSSTVGIRADFYPENAAGSAVTGRFQLIPAATPGDTGSYGTAQEGRCYIRLSGVPQLGDSDHFTVVGSVTVTISRQAE